MSETSETIEAMIQIGPAVEVAHTIAVFVALARQGRGFLAQLYHSRRNIPVQEVLQEEVPETWSRVEQRTDYPALPEEHGCCYEVRKGTLYPATYCSAKAKTVSIDVDCAGVTIVD